MNTLSRIPRKRLCTFGGALVLATVAVVLLLTGGAGPIALAAPPEAPQPAAGLQVELAANVPARTMAAPLPATTCTLVGSTRTCEIWAKAGTLLLPTGVTVPVWGFALDAADPAQVPGPALVANEGEEIKVVLHNELVHNAIPMTVSLSFPGQMIMPDFMGITAGDTVTYTFTANEAGTYLYEAGLTPDGARQVAMGLFGALVIRPAATDQANAGAHSAFDAEALLVFSEIDPAFNNDPMGFLMENFRPEYWLINGQAYPETDNIPVAGGDRLLLRLINGGVEQRSIGLLGLRQEIVGMDGQAITSTRTTTVVAAQLAPGSSTDGIATIPADAEEGTLYALYNAALLNHNSNWRLQPSNRLQPGGMITFIEVSPGTVASNIGPVVTSATASPDATTGTSGVTLTFQLSAATGGSVDAVELFTNTVGAPGTGAALPMTPGQDITVQTTLSAETLATWPSGYYDFYLRGRDGAVWGAVGATILNLDKLGPDTTALSVLPDPTNGTKSVMLRGTADDHTNGNAAIASATYTIDGGTPQPMVLNLPGEPISEISALISSAVLDAMAEGQHVITVVSEDVLGNQGTPATLTLHLDKTGPDASGVMATPNLIDLTTGALPVGNVRLDGQLADPLTSGVQSNVATAEAFIGTPGTPGTGFALFPKDGLFNEPTEDAFFQIPIANFLTLAQGDHAIWMRGRDAAGNWGTAISITVTVERGVNDQEGPVTDIPRIRPNPTRGTTLVTLEADITDPGALSDIAAAEWFVNVDNGVGTGFPMVAADGTFDEPIEMATTTIDVSTWTDGNYRIYVRGMDSAGNWGAATLRGFRVNNNHVLNILLNTFDTDLTQWARVVGDVTLVPEAQMGNAMVLSANAAMGMKAALNGETPSYVALDLPPGERSIDASFYFHPNGAAIASEHNLFVGRSRTQSLFGIEVESSPEGYEVRAWVLDNGVVSATNWVSIGYDPAYLKLHWEANSSARFTLTVNDTETSPPVPPDTMAYTLHEIRLGPSDDLSVGLSGAEYFDMFQMNRYAFLYLPITTVE